MCIYFKSCDDSLSQAKLVKLSEINVAHTILHPEFICLFIFFSSEVLKGFIIQDGDANPPITSVHDAKNCDLSHTESKRMKNSVYMFSLPSDS